MLKNHARFNKVVLRDQPLQLSKADNVKGGLVVIAIIAILHSMLLPACQKPKPEPK